RRPTPASDRRTTCSRVLRERPTKPANAAGRAGAPPDCPGARASPPSRLRRYAGAMTDTPDLSHLRPDTRAVRAGIARSDAAEMSEGLFLTQGYVYDSAESAEAAFAGEIDV